MLYPKDFKGEHLFFDPTLEVLEWATKAWGDLFDIKVAATSTSPAGLTKPDTISDVHRFLCAIDIAFETERELRYAVEVFREASKNTMWPIRLGWGKHLERNLNFIHVDTAPALADAAYSAEFISPITYRKWKIDGLEW